MSPLPTQPCRRFLASDVLAANVRAWRAFAGVPIYAVVKADGYGWGLATMVRALEGLVDAYCVADSGELELLRLHTAERAIVLGDVPAGDLRSVLDRNARASVQTAEQLEEAAGWAAQHGQPLRIRVGLAAAAGWSGLSLEDVARFAPLVRTAGAEVEAWTHITDLDAVHEQVRNFDEALALFARQGVTVAQTELASTLPLARGLKRGDAVRIGIGLFGGGDARVPGVHCALHVSGPAIRLERHSAGTRLGYGDTMLEMETALAVVRCGYSDGLPSSLQGSGDTLSVGMQYATVRADALEPGGATFVWLDARKSLDAFAASAGRDIHEIVTTFGNCARAAAVHKEV